VWLFQIPSQMRQPQIHHKFSQTRVHLLHQISSCGSFFCTPYRTHIVHSLDSANKSPVSRNMTIGSDNKLNLNKTWKLWLN
jgi:hypothetical protein